MDRPNAKQWEAVRHADRHVLVAAGAGTGKTSTVVNRILYLLGVEIEGSRHPTPITLRDVAAITYTNTAAADLKAKLRKALRTVGLRDAAYDVDSARIGTIHGFCGDILREFALRSNLNPGTSVLDESEATAIGAEAVRETVLQALDEDAVEGLEALFSVWPVATVEAWLIRLIGDSDRLLRIASHLDTSSGHEATVVRLASLALARHQARLDELGAIDFDRMIVLARDLLRDHEHARRALQRRIRMLVVDEFQDVDPVQKEIAYLLGEPNTRGTETTRLMLVGDPKQSIYRFRRADVTVWSEVERDFTQNELGLVVELEENFRSVEPVLAFVDAAIGPILDRSADGESHRSYEVRYRSVRATRALDGGEPAVELLVVPPGPDGKAVRASDVRDIEASAVARRMRELHAGGTRWGDMAVLLAGWGALETYEQALRGAQIPTYALRAEGFYERREVLDLILALEVIRDPTDDRALAGFLRSPFVGLRDETLLAIARDIRPPYWEALGGARVAEDDLLRHGVALLRDHVALRDRVPTHELLESLLERSGYLAYLTLLGGDGMQALANVRKFVAYARRLADHGTGDFLRIVKELRSRGTREGDASGHGAQDDVVTITSIHSAKGLEWDVVFWCDLIRSPGGYGSEDFLIGRERLAIKDPDLDAKSQPPSWHTLLREEELEQAAERKRLWYVAATRAKDRLVLSGIALGKADARCPSGALQELLPALRAPEGTTLVYEGQRGRRFEAMIRVLHDDETTVVADDPATHADVTDAELYERLPRPLPRLEVPAGRMRRSATELLTYTRCARRHWFRYVQGLPEPRVVRSGTEFVSALARGQIVHDALEHLVEEADLGAALEAAIGRWDPDAPTPEHRAGQQYRERLADEIRLVATHPEYRALAAEPSARRELAFVHVADGDLVVEGTIDLATRDADGLVLLDVKTYQGSEEAARRHVAAYAVQRDLYVTAAEAIAGVPVNRFAFQFSRAGIQVSDPVSDEMRKMGRDSLMESVASRGEKRPALTAHPAECRFCGYRRPGWCTGVRTVDDDESAS